MELRSHGAESSGYVGRPPDRLFRAGAGLARLGTAMLDLAFPRQCAVCHGSLGAESWHVCWDCLAGLWPVQSPYCSLCGNPVAGRIEHEYLCAFCVDLERHFDRARSAVHYDGAIKGLLHSFKYANATHLLRDLGMLANACVGANYDLGEIDAVTYVPLHHARQRDRSYNQSRLLAAEIARLQMKPLLGSLSRCRVTETQTALTAQQRRKNVEDAFVARNPRWIEGRRFLLVDDVMTTGATVSECAKVLKGAGAVKVLVTTVARGQRK